MGSYRHTAFAGAAAVSLAALVVSGCGMAPGRFASSAQGAERVSDNSGGVARAEVEVAAHPRAAAARIALGRAYMKAGRFASAAQAFDDALELGDQSGRTALAIALCQVALGKGQAAAGVLDQWADQIPAADLGLAYALAGRTDQGVQVLGEALRAGDVTPKLRQNLAYAYALGGRWQEARLMALQDLPADQAAARLLDWAQLAQPGAEQHRVAALLSAPVVEDQGFPQALALADGPQDGPVAPSDAVRVALPEAPARAVPVGGELPAKSDRPVELASLSVPASAVSAMQAQAIAPQAAARRFVSEPVIQALPARQAPLSAVARPAVTRPATVRMVMPKAVAAPSGRLAPVAAAPVRAVAGGKAMVQLGSYLDAGMAKGAWIRIAASHPGLKGFRPVFTSAAVNGRTYYRVSAAGFASRDDAGSMCRSVKARGGACFVVPTT